MADSDRGDEQTWTEYSEAEARIGDLHAGLHSCPGGRENAQPINGAYLGCDTLRLLAFERRDDPYYQQAWCPSDLPRVVRTEAPRR